MSNLLKELQEAHRESPSWRLFGLCHQAATRIAALEAQLAELAEVVRILSDQESGELDRRLALKDASRILSAFEATPAPEQRELSAEDVSVFDQALMRSGRKVEATPPAPMVTEAKVDAALAAFEHAGRYAYTRARIKAALIAAQEKG